jgi:hypothetical protein
VSSGLPVAVLSGNLVTQASYNFETTSGGAFSVSLSVADKGGLTVAAQFSITVLNVNDPPTDITYTGSLQVLENSTANTVLGSFSTVDEDSGDTFSYVLVSQTVSGALALSAAGELTLARTFDYEVDGNIVVVSIRSTDAGGASTTKGFTFSVVDVNEPPASASLSNNIVAELSASGTVVGAITVFDPDDGDIISLSLTSQSPTAAFAISGTDLVVAGPVDFESTGGSYALMLRVVDSLGLVLTVPLSVIVTGALLRRAHLRRSHKCLAQM